MIIHTRLTLLCTVLLSILISCKETKETTTLNEPAKEGSQVSELASNEAFISGRIVSVSQERDTDGPCSKAPCVAEVKVESISNKGKLFRLDNMDEIIKVNFSYTLSPTETIFPSMQKHYPGLVMKDQFEAKIQSRISLNDVITYTIRDYTKLHKPEPKPYHREK